MEIVRYSAKSIVREERGSNNIHLNPYQGCWHDCVYCDGKAENYHMHEDFGSVIRVKENAPDLLEKYLRKRGFLPINREITGTLMDVDVEPPAQPDKFIIGISGGVCDIYQPAEADVGLSRKLLQVAYDFGFPVSLLTKSALVLRDLDVLKKISEGAGATVCMTVVFSEENDNLREIFEPRASAISERFDALKKLHEAGIKTGIWMLPILPWICDSDENPESMVRSAAKAGVGFILPGGLTLKPGRSKNEFFNALKKHFPDLLTKYSRLYRNNSRYGEPDRMEASALGAGWYKDSLPALCQEYGIELRGWD